MSAIISFLRARLGWIIFILLVVVGVAGYYGYQEYQAQQAKALSLTQLREETLQRGDIVSLVSATGSLQPARQANLVFLLPGQVTEVLVKSGDTVKAGDLLARVDDADLKLAVEQAAAALEVAKLNRQKLSAGPTEGDIAIAKANLRSANASAYDLTHSTPKETVEIAQLQYNTVKDSYQKAADQYNSMVRLYNDPNAFFKPSQETLDDLKLNMDAAYYQAEASRLQVEQTKQGAADRGSISVAYARIAQAQAVLSQTLAGPTDVQIARADLQVEQAQLALDQAKARVTKTELRAPFDGVVSTVNVKVGEIASSNTPAMVLLDNTQYRLDITVNEVDVTLLSLGQAVKVTADAFTDQPFDGVVETIAPTSIVVGGAVNYVVRISITPSELPLRSGMSATAQVTVDEVKDVVMVPNWAIRRDRRTGEAFASLKVGDALQEVLIETGLRGESYTEAKSGVKAGDIAAISTQPTSILTGGN